MTTADHPEDSWGKRALCTSEGHPNWWDDYLDRADDGSLQESAPARLVRHELAKGVCRRCPVWADCQLHTDIDTEDGIRFGQLMSELREARDSRKRLNFEVLRRSA